MTNDEYHAAEGINKSQLDAIHVSPLNYWHKYLNPNKTQEIEKPYLLFGEAVHNLILEPDLFKQKFALDFDKTKFPSALETIDDMKEELRNRGLKLSGTKQELSQRLIDDGCPIDEMLWYQEAVYKEINKSKILLPVGEYEHALCMLDRLQQHHTAGKLLDGAITERAFFVQDEYGLTRKCKTDAITSNGKVWLDVKSTNDVSVVGFGRTIAKYRYHVQAAWYMDVARLALGSDAPQLFAFIAIQKEAPYDISVQYMTEVHLELGRKVYMNDYALLRECMVTNIWPGADGGKILEAQLPKWAEYENSILEPEKN